MRLHAGYIDLMLKDGLLNILNELRMSLVEIVDATWEFFEYHDINSQEHRVVCAACGLTSSYTTSAFIARHQPWCRFGKIVLNVVVAERYLGL